MTTVNGAPTTSYGILQQIPVETDCDEVVEQVKALGFAILDSGYTAVEMQGIAAAFDRTRKDYLEIHGEAHLREIDEFYTVRSPLTHGGDEFLRLALNANLLSALKQLISGKFIINQQNGLVNPSRETYNQAAWHRDLPYQHFVSSRPLAINALFCVDDFTRENGATYVLPASHKSEDFPSAEYIQKNAIQVEAKAGSFIVLDCMVFHAGGFNHSDRVRRAINHVYNIPYFKQQINIPRNLKHVELTAEQRDILGFDYMEPDSISDYFATRKGNQN